MERSGMISYLGGAGGLYQELEQKILEECPEAEVVLAGSRVEKSSFRLYRRKKFIAYCNVHDGFFDMMTRLSAREAERAEAVAAGLSAYAREVWENRYPCGDGAWIHYLVRSREGMDEAFALLATKLNTP